MDAIIEIFDCRKRLLFSEKLKLGMLVLKENGVAWTFWWAMYYLATAAAHAASHRMHAIRLAKGVPGMNSPAINRFMWNSWRWDDRGEEWTASEAWLESLSRRCLQRYIKDGSRLLEIGVGAGRWTSRLLPTAKHLTGVDISAKCLELCRERFGNMGKVDFHLGRGSDLQGIEDESIDAIVSMNSFVHINACEAGGYAAEFPRVLVPGGYGIIHHGSMAGKFGGCRSNLTTDIFRKLLEDNGLEVIEQFNAWDDAGVSFDMGVYPDVITVFRRPSA